MADNKLYYGDNLDVLRRYVKDESVDLVYLDPPFNSRQGYNVLFAEKDGTRSASQIMAFEDTWEWNQESSHVYEEIVERGGSVAEVMIAFHTFLRGSDMMAYLAMMAPRLVELHRVLKVTGSIYLHCDPTASHYLKMLMDAIFSPWCFRSEIVWKRSSAHSDTKQGRKQHGRIHDIVLFYTKGEAWTWNPLYTAYDDDYVRQFYKYEEEGTGRRYRLGDLTGPGGAAKGNPQYEVMGVTRYWRYTKEKMQALIEQGRVIQTQPGAVPAYKRYLDEMQGVPLQIRWIVLAIQESRQAEDAVAVCAGGIAAKGNREQFQGAFLLFESKAVNPPEDLVLTERSREDCVRWGNRIGSPERSEMGLPVGIQVEIQMPHCGDALFGAFAAARAQRIGGHIDVRADRVFVRKPAEVTRRKRTLQRNDSLKNPGRSLASKKQRNRLTWSEATGEEVGSDIRRILCPMLWHVSPRIPARSGSVLRRGRSREGPGLHG
jgi:hypothetical protein